jgi:hypothetical protein
MIIIKPEIPEGWEIDKEKSTFEEIVLKQIKKELPKTWRELKEINGWYFDQMSTISKYVHGAPLAANKNTFATESQAKAAIALAQLSQLREVYRDGWEPDLEDEHSNTYVIKSRRRGIKIEYIVGESYFLSFQSLKITIEFYSNFRDLIIEAAPLLFGEEIKQ